jgi:hypothetical protein
VRLPEAVYLHLLKVKSEACPINYQKKAVGVRKLQQLSKKNGALWHRL